MLVETVSTEKVMSEGKSFYIHAPATGKATAAGRNKETIYS